MTVPPREYPSEENDSPYAGSPSTAHVVLSGTDQDLQHARTRARALLEGHHEDCAVNVLRVLDELLSDALTRGGAQRQARLIITGDAARVLIEVDSVETSASSDEHIAGTIVDQLTSEWGVEQRKGLRTAWAVINLVP